MELILEHKPVQQTEAESLAVIVYQREDSESRAMAGPSAATVNELAHGWIGELLVNKEFTGKLLDTALLHRPAGLSSKRLLLIGGGKAGSLTVDDIRRIAGVALRSMKAKGCRDLCLALDPGIDSPDMVQAAVEGAVLGDFEPDAHKTDPAKDEKGIDRFRVNVTDASSVLNEALRRGQIVGESQNFARRLVNEPANLLPPTRMVAEARKMAAETGLGIDVLDEAKMTELGMGALLGVSQGSAEPGYLVVLRYQPTGHRAATAHLGLVGKGVTFDTGGISIKPSDGMEKMKYDMAGAAAVFGAMRAIAQLKPSIPVTAFAPCVENMASDRAQRPGDIVKTYNGKTVEVLNTDAEGRLILADALTYAIKQGCTHLVDAATLTGAIGVALGHIYAGLFANEPGMKDRVMAAGQAGGERLWPMPLDDDYKEYLKSAFADLPNIGGRYGGAVTAAKFLEEFVEGRPWVHLDIAGTAWMDDGKPFLAKGPTGMGVRTFVRLAMDWKG